MTFSVTRFYVYPNVAKVGGLHSQGGKGTAIVDLLQALGNAESDPPSCIKKMADNWATRMNIESKPH